VSGEVRLREEEEKKKTKKKGKRKRQQNDNPVCAPVSMRPSLCPCASCGVEGGEWRVIGWGQSE